MFLNRCFIAAVAFVVGATVSVQLPAFEHAKLPRDLNRTFATSPPKPLEVQIASDKPARLPAQVLEKRQEQLGDDPVQPFQPAIPESERDQKRIKAAAWFMAGQLKESRNDFRGAMEAYRNAIAIDPKAIVVYRALVPLAFSLNSRDAVGYALKAVELDPGDYQLLRRLGVHMASQRKLPEAIRLFEQAAKSSSLPKDSGVYVTLNREMGILYGALGQKEKAADAFAVVFDALKSPEKYKLDFRLRRALETDEITSYERLGEIFLEVKRTTLAIEALERAAKSRDGRASTLNFNLANVYFQTGNFNRAEEELNRYLDAQLQSKGRLAYQLLSDIYKGQKKKPEVLIARLEKLSEQDKRNSVLQFFLADQYVAAGRLKEAEELYKSKLGSGDDGDGYAGLAGIYRRQNRLEELLEALGKALKGAGSGEQLERNIGRIQQEIKAIAADAKMSTALLELGERQIKDGEKLSFESGYVLSKIAEEAKDEKRSHALIRYSLKKAGPLAAILYEELGQQLLEKNRYAEAAALYREATKDRNVRQEARPQFLYRLSQSEELAGNTKAGLEAVQEARKLLPDVSLLHYQEAWIYYHAKRYNEAIKLFEEVISKYPPTDEIVRRAKFSLSNIYVQQGNYDKGEAILEKVLEENPDDPSVNNDLGYLYADRGKNLEKAESMIRKALAAEPENPAYLDSMGWVLFKRGKYAEAVPHLEKAVKKPTGGDATIFDHLGDCYEKLGRKEKAREAWKKALEDAKKASNPDQKLISTLEKKLGVTSDGKAEGPKTGKEAKPSPASSPAGKGDGAK